MFFKNLFSKSTSTEQKRESAESKKETQPLKPKAGYQSCNIENPDGTLHQVQIKVISADKAKATEDFLKKRLLEGNQISLSSCRELQDTVDDVKIWEAICQNHIARPFNPPIDLDDEGTYADYFDMILIMITSCVDKDNDWVRLSPDFMRKIIATSTSLEALNCIESIEYEDLLDHAASGEGNFDYDLLMEFKYSARNRMKALTE